MKVVIDGAENNRRLLWLINCPHHLQRALAEFPLRVANAASDLKQACDYRDHQEGGTSADEYIAVLSATIEEEFRKSFGFEIRDYIQQIARGLETGEGS